MLGGVLTQQARLLYLRLGTSYGHQMLLHGLHTRRARVMRRSCKLKNPIALHHYRVASKSVWDQLHVLASLLQHFGWACVR